MKPEVSGMTPTQNCPTSLHLHRTTKQRSGRTHSCLQWTSKRQSSGRGPH